MQKRLMFQKKNLKNRIWDNGTDFLVCNVNHSHFYVQFHIPMSGHWINSKILHCEWTHTLSSLQMLWQSFFLKSKWLYNIIVIAATSKIMKWKKCIHDNVSVCYGIVIIAQTRYRQGRHDNSIETYQYEVQQVNTKQDSAESRY